MTNQGSSVTEAPTGRIAVLVVNYASSEMLAKNVVPLSRARDDLIVIVVDNRSNPEERRSVESLGRSAGWLVMPQEENIGFGAAMNIAASRAIELGSDHLLLLNPDASIDARSVDLLAEAAGRRTLAAPTITRPDGTIWSGGSDLSLEDGRVWGRRRRPPGASVMEWLTGACLMISVTLWNEIGGFDDHYFLYWEDVDLSWKVHHAGATLELVPGAFAVHDTGATQGGPGSSARPKSELYYYFNIRNRLVFAALRLGAPGLRRWWARSPDVVWGVLRIGGRRHLLRSWRPWRAAGRGLLDGWRMSRAIVEGRRPPIPRAQSSLR